MTISWLILIRRIKYWRRTGKAKGMTMAEPMRRRRRRWLLVVLICVVMAYSIGNYVYQHLPGIQVTIQNTGSTPLRSVVLYVTGGSYPLGAIAAGGSAEATIRSTGKSHLEIEFADVDGKLKRVNAGGYFSREFRGTIRVSIKDGAIDKIEQKTTISY
jgi:hypothetical protein